MPDEAQATVSRRKWLPMGEGLSRLFPRTEPDHWNDHGGAVSPQHDKGWHLHGDRHVERQLGQPKRADYRNQKHQPHRKHNRK
jgi:hypothetical protein